ncbi:hypothetical protein ELH26_14430 [Rhizobium leguminosarum]|uniref:hypothetical protein n=1 Tax=Rhizobium leguminosarum TaxID=384 RepID=UPI0010316BF9|nr:hypothetical protein [Rhizobium leguminosarum]TBC95142.1 hypothetical protein ELH26_14430 [Rhizobium leguminosarum]
MRGTVETWVNSQWKYLAAPGQLSVEINTLKCLRNFFHHHQELLNTVRLIPTTGMPISTDLLFLCLIPSEAVEAAIAQSQDRFRSAVRDACQETFHWYGSVVNINPCIFNFGMAAFERLTEANVQMTGDAANRLRASYEMEEEEGHSHFVDGRIATSAATMSQLLSEIARTGVGR